MRTPRTLTRHVAVSGVAVVIASLTAAAPAAATRPVSVTGKVCTILGTIGDDHLNGGRAADVICGLGGDDVIDGGGGADVIDGGGGNDIVNGGDGNDRLYGGGGNDTLHGGNGGDYGNGGDGTDALDGGSGTDALDGGLGNDVIKGGSTTDDPNPGKAGDRINGGGGGDTIHGGPGNDTIHGGPGDDKASGDDGNDTTAGDDGNDDLDGGPGRDHIHGGPGNDNVHGDNGDDTLDGNAGNDHLDGGPGNDHANGNDGEDIANGNDGNDALDGGEGDDTLDGGPGSDRTEGGSGINSCERDQEDDPIDRCTDTDAPNIVMPTLRWITDPVMNNVTDTVIRARVHVKDDRSGMMYVQMTLRSPDPSAPPIKLGNHWRELVAGKVNNGTFEMRATVPAASAVGTWTVQEVYVQDNVSRYTRYTVTENGNYTSHRVNGATGQTNETGTVQLTPLVVNGVADVAAPAVDVAAASWTTPTTLDNGTDQPLALRFPATDDLSGVTTLTVTLSGDASDDPPLTLRSQRLVSGVTTNGMWEMSGTLPAYLPTGTWTVSRIEATDRVGHKRTLQPDGGPWPSPLTVTGSTDEQLPTAEMTGVYVGDTTADNSTDRTVRLRVRAADDLSGVANVFADYRTTGAQSRLDPRVQAGPDGVWELVGTLPKGTTPGSWRVTGIYVTDKVGRQRVYYIQSDGSYTTSDHALSGAASFPIFTLLSCS